MGYSMKIQVLFTLFMVSVLILPYVSADEVSITSSEVNAIADQTHTVFAEYFTSTGCGYCPEASSQLFSIYNSGDYEFFYVSLVADKNLAASKRYNELAGDGVPDVYFDGTARHLLGRQNDEQPYRSSIDFVGSRAVASVDIDLACQWTVGGTLSITADVSSEDDFDGTIRLYIVEKQSRWNDASQSPYHFGVLDIPIEKSLALRGNAQPLGDVTIRKLWIPSLKGFTDLDQSNVMVIATVFDTDTGKAVQAEATEPALAMTEETHTVLLEYLTTSWCPQCPVASEALWELYNEESAPDFNYVTFVSDLNDNANQRSWWGFLNRVIPSVYVDGGVLSMFGNAGSLQATKDAYQDLVIERADDEVHDLDMVINTLWNDGVLEVDVEIVNNGGVYCGFLKSYVCEVDSRYQDVAQDPYHFGMLDFAMNRLLILLPGQSKTLSADWNAEDAGFGDVDPSNLAVVSGAYDLLHPQLMTGYESPEFTQRYVALFCDQSAVSILA